MKDQSGRVALKRTFNAGGSFRVSGPGFREALGRGEAVVVEENHVELRLQAEDSDVPKILEASPWFDLVDADIEVSVVEPGDCNPATDTLGIAFRGGRGRGLELAISSAQARAVNEILTNYIRSRESWEALKKVYPVSAED